LIYARMYAGMGNQMFQYAFARALQEKTGQKICFDISEGSDIITSDVGKSEFVLRGFDIKTERVRYIATSEEFKRLAGPKMRWAIALEGMPRLLRKLTRSDKAFTASERAVQQIYNKRGYYTTFDYYCPPIVRERPNYYISGLFTCEKYFHEIKELLLKEFTPVVPIDKANGHFLDRIDGCERAVCVHVRKGNDYVKNPSLNVCSPGYYEKALRMIADTHSDAVFFIFSNDLKWARESLSLEKYNAVFVDANSGAQPVQELRLMMRCRDFVLSNSTMSWWAQYLSHHDDREVIAPAKWSAGKIIQLRDLDDEQWRKIDDEQR